MQRSIAEGGIEVVWGRFNRFFRVLALLVKEKLKGQSKTAWTRKAEMLLLPLLNIIIFILRLNHFLYNSNLYILHRSQDSNI